jgi:chemotaxis protein CheZ
MEKSLLKELKELLELIESFKNEISEISSKRSGFNLANNHIQAAISESEEAAKKLIDYIGKSLEDVSYLMELSSTIKEPELKEKLTSRLSDMMSRLTESLTLLEFQDILAQRLLKVKSFLTELEKSLLKIALLAGIEEKGEEQEELKKKMEELEWKKEVSQEDVDEIMKQFGL